MVTPSDPNGQQFTLPGQVQTVQSVVVSLDKASCCRFVAL